MPIIRWEPPTYSPSSLVTDGPWGRFLIKRERKGARNFIVHKNGKPWPMRGDKQSCRVAVEANIKIHFPSYESTDDRS